jgi:hypothetical protein
LYVYFVLPRRARERRGGNHVAARQIEIADLHVDGQREPASPGRDLAGLERRLGLPHAGECEADHIYGRRQRLAVFSRAAAAGPPSPAKPIPAPATVAMFLPATLRTRHPGALENPVSAM